MSRGRNSSTQKDGPEYIMVEYIWTTQDGYHIPISKLGDNHLRGIIRKLQTDLKSAQITFLRAPNEEAEEEIEDYIASLHALLAIMLEEQTRRTLH